MKLSSIDIGSNTVLLLIADFNIKNYSLTTILNRYEIPRLSRNLENEGIISQNSLEKFFNILKYYKQEVKKRGCTKVITKATNAMRMAKNSDEIIKEVKEKFGINIEVISGEEEARLSYLGSTSNSNSERNVVIDIGGGSTEIIYGNLKQIIYRKSFPIGAVSLTEQYFHSFPVETNTLNQVKEDLILEFKEILQSIDIIDSNIISVAGTPTTIAAVEQNLDFYDEMKIENYVISYESLSTFVNSVSKLRPEQILKKHPFVKGREDVLLAGSIILKVILNILGASKTIVSGRGLRYGILIDYILKNYSHKVNGELIVR